MEAEVGAGTEASPFSFAALCSHLGLSYPSMVTYRSMVDSPSPPLCSGPTAAYPDVKHGAEAIDFSLAYHQFAVEWAPNGLTFFVDGIKTGSGVPRPYLLLLSSCDPRSLDPDVHPTGGNPLKTRAPTVPPPPPDPQF